MGLFDKILDDVLGFDPPKQVTGRVSTLTPNQKGIEKALSQLAMGQLGGRAIGDQGRTFPGQFALGPSPIQQQVFGQAPGVAGNVQQALQGFAQSTPGIDAIGTVLAGGRGFLEDELSRVANRYGQLDATSSSAARDAMNRTLRNFTLASQAQALPIQVQAGQQDAQRQLQANLSMLDLQNFLASVGGQQRGIATEQLLGERQKFELGDPTRSPQVQLALGLLGQRFAEPFQTTETPLGTQAGGAFLGGLAQPLGAAAGSGIASAAGGALSGLGGLLSGALSFI